MTFLQMQTMLADLLQYDLDNYQGESPAATDVAEQLNYAARFISRQIYQYDPSIAMTLTIDDGDMDLYGSAFTRDIFEVRRVIIDGTVLTDPSGQPGLWTLGEMEADQPSWRTTTSAKPRRAFQVDQVLYLWPKPDAAYANNFVAGQYLCAELTGSDTSLSYDLPSDLHVAVVRLAADFAADPTVSEQEGLARLQRYASKAGADIADIRRRNRKLAQIVKSTPGSNSPNFVAL